jgi:predicted amidophosphoribosyltransferase
MPLINCPACGREISIEAEACPGCGHPNRPRAPSGPSCYACSAAATTRCQSCGALSCAEHLQSIYVWHGQGGAYELRCQSCYSSAMTWQVLMWVIAGIVLVIILLAFLFAH